MVSNATMTSLAPTTSSTAVHFARPRKQEISLGMVFLGVVFSSILYGVMMTQTQKYYERFKKDQKIVKVLVFAVFILNTASVVLICHAGWYYLVTTGVSSRSIWSLNVEVMLSMIMSGLTETFLAFRVYRLSGNNVWLLGLLLSLVLFHFVSGEVAAIGLLRLRTQAMVSSAKVPTILRLSSAALCDTMIAASLSFFLHKKRTGFKRTDEMIDYMILFSINSGLLLSATSIGSLILYVTVPHTWVYTALCFLLSRLYATTFLSSLNSRKVLLSDDDDNNDLPKTKPAFRPHHRSAWSIHRTESPEKTPTQIYVVTETITDHPPQILSPSKIRTTISNIQIREVEEGSRSSSSSASDSRPVSPSIYCTTS